jgi:hypothetical protein
VLLFGQSFSEDVFYVIVRMYIRVVDHFLGMEISTVLIAYMNMFGLGLDNSRSYVSKSALIVTVDWQW